MIIYPWQEQAWQRLQSIRHSLPHAWLLQGREGIGKLHFAEAFARSLLCESVTASGLACGVCTACHWYAQGNHPDFRRVEPQAAQPARNEVADSADATDKKDPTQITVDQVRELHELLDLTAHRPAYRVILIHPAEAMNTHAANALLKMLEEPPARTVFLLVCHDTQRLLPTVASRCRRLALTSPAFEEGRRWLEQQGIPDAALHLAQSGNAPLKARALSDAQHRTQRREFLGALCRPGRLEPHELSDSMQKLPLAGVLDWLGQWCFDLMAAKLTGEIRYNPDFAESILHQAARADLAGLIAFESQLRDARRFVDHPLNPRLFLEQLLLSYSRMYTN